MMKCFRCIVRYQNRKQQEIFDAVTVYGSEALCSTHLNTVRGLPAAFERYPKEPS